LFMPGTRISSGFTGARSDTNSYQVVTMAFFGVQN
jgi:hypothetical protein